MKELSYFSITVDTNSLLSAASGAAIRKCLRFINLEAPSTIFILSNEDEG